MLMISPPDPDVATLPVVALPVVVSGPIVTPVEPDDPEPAAVPLVPVVAAIVVVPTVPPVIAPAVVPVEDVVVPAPVVPAVVAVVPLAPVPAVVVPIPAVPVVAVVLPPVVVPCPPLPPVVPPVVVPVVPDAGRQSVFTHASASMQSKWIHPVFCVHAQPRKLPVLVSMVTPPFVGAKLIQPVFSPHAQPASVPLLGDVIITPVYAQSGPDGEGLAGSRLIQPQSSDQISPESPVLVTLTGVPFVVRKLIRVYVVQVSFVQSRAVWLPGVMAPSVVDACTDKIAGEKKQRTARTIMDILRIRSMEPREQAEQRTDDRRDEIEIPDDQNENSDQCESVFFREILDIAQSCRHEREKHFRAVERRNRNEIEYSEGDIDDDDCRRDDIERMRVQIIICGQSQ